LWPAGRSAIAIGNPVAVVFAGAAYTASKHGIIGLAANVAYAYAKKGIRSNVIAPAASTPGSSAVKT